LTWTVSRPPRAPPSRATAARAASEGQIADLFRTFDPAQVIEGAGASVGTPIVGPDSTVESGNGRIAAMRRLRDEAPERWAAYQQALRDAGYDPEPGQVLVRRRTSELSPEELRQFVTDANSSPTLGMSGTERGMVDRDLVDQGLLSQLDTNADLFAASNDRFVRGFIGKLPANERATMLDTDGRLSQDGARRIEGAILARAYGDPALLQRIVEDRDDDTRSVSKALLSAAPAWIGLQDAVKRGEVKPEFDATPRLLDAVRMLRDMRARKLKANDFLAQQDVFTQPDPLATAFFRLFFNDSLTRATGAEKIAKVLERYAAEAEQRSPNPLFPDDTTPLQALEAARKDPQGGLFSSRVQPTPGTVSADVAKARQVVANRLAELRAMGKQGVKAAEAVERAMRGPFSPQQVVAAFRIGETAARILGDRSLVIRFLPEIMHEGEEKQGELRHVSPEGTNGLVHFSLSKSSLAFARQTGAHEAFHVAQALFAASEPKLWAELKRAFPEGKGLGGIDATIRRKLQTLRPRDGAGSYWDQLMADKGVEKTAGTSIEAQAYVFGALDDARRNGQSLVGIPAMLLRFANFLAEMRQRLASVLRGDGFRSVGDTLEAVSAGTGLRGLTKARDLGAAFSSRDPASQLPAGYTLRDVTQRSTTTTNGVARDTSKPEWGVFGRYGVRVETGASPEEAVSRFLAKQGQPNAPTTTGAPFAASPTAARGAELSGFFGTQDAVRDALRSGQLRSIPERESKCYPFAGQAAIDTGNELVIGTVSDGAGKRISHALMRDSGGRLYDPQFDRWFDAKLYSDLVGGFEPTHVLTSAEVKDFAETTGKWPDPTTLKRAEVATPKGDTLRNFNVERAPRPDGRVDYLLTAEFAGGGNLQVYASATPDGTLDVIDIAPKGVENNPHRFETNSELYQGVRLGPAETRKMLRQLSNAAKADGIAVRSVSGFRETGARRTSGQQDLAYNLGNLRFSSRSRPADLSGDAAIQAAYDATKGQGPSRPGWFDRTMAKITGAVPGESYSQALYRNAVNRAAPLYILDEMKRSQGVPDSRALGRMADRAFNNVGRLEMVLEHGFIGYDPKTDRTTVRKDVPSVLAAFVGPDRKNPRVKDGERDDFQNYLALLRERDLLRAGRSGFKKLTARQALDGIAAIEAKRPAWKDAAADIHKINRAAVGVWCRHRHPGAGQGRRAGGDVLHAILPAGRGRGAEREPGRRHCRADHLQLAEQPPRLREEGA
jgi:hypothetical protein